MMKHILFFLGFGLFLSVAPALAEVSIETSVSRSIVGVGDELTLDIIVSNANGSIQKPKFPSVDGFTSYSQGHSQQISIVNGSMSSTSVYSYVLIANSTGKKTIGPFEIVIGNRSYKAAAVEVDVRPENAPVQTQAGGPAYSQGYPTGAPPQRAMPGEEVSSQDIFVKAWLDKDEVYVNEAATLTYTIYTRLSATYKGFEKEPVLTGFWVEDFPPDKNVRKTEQVLNGARYVVADVRKVALFPTEAGSFTVDPGVLSSMVEVRGQDDFDSFFSYNIFGRRSPMIAPFAQVYSKPLPTQKIKLTVKSLPEAGKPAGFTGAVGDYQIESSVDKSEVEAGTPVTHRLRIAGQGNVSTLKPPAFPKLENFKIYDSSSSSNVAKNRFIVEGDKTIETVLVPKKAGSFTIPPVSFSYFDPKAGAYRELKTESHALTVKPGSEPEEASAAGSGVEPAEKTDVNLIAQDIHYIKTSDAPNAFPKALYKKPFYWVLNILLIFLSVTFAVLAAKRTGDGKDQKGMRLRQSHRLARQKLKSSSAFMKKGRPDEFYSEISRAVHGYFADKLNLSGRSVEFEAIENHFKQIEAPNKTLDEAKALFHELALKRFGQSDKSQEEMRRIYEMADRVITNFEKVKRK